MASACAPTNRFCRVRFDEQIEQLLALNEDMIEQLHLERTESPGPAVLLTGMIDEHRRTVAMLRAKVGGA